MKLNGLVGHVQNRDWLISSLTVAATVAEGSENETSDLEFKFRSTHIY